MGWLIDLARAEAGASPLPAALASLLSEACQGVSGIDTAIFRSLLSAEDVQTILGGHIPALTLNAYAKSFAEGIQCGRIRVLAIPKTGSVTTAAVQCAGCQHFDRDRIGDGSGIGECGVGGEGTGPKQTALFPGAWRQCKDFLNSTGRSGTAVGGVVVPKLN